MRIMFIDPPKPGAGRTRTTRVSLPDLALGYLASNMLNHRHEVKIIDSDTNNFDIPDVLKLVNEYDPQIICMTVFTYKLRQAAELARAVKANNPSITVIVGGAHPTALTRETLESCDSFDYSVCGEGENTLLQLIGAIENGGALSTINRLTWRDEENIVSNNPGPHQENPDEFSFPLWEDFDLKKYGSLYSKEQLIELPIITSRGCSGTCSFCYRMQGGKIRFRSINNVINEIEKNISVHGAKSLVFMDQVFTSDTERVSLLCDAMNKIKVRERASWVCQTRADSIDMETMRLIHEAGCTHISCGIESGSEDVLKSNGKKLDLKLVKESLSIAKEAGLTVDTNYILGLPYDNKKTIMKTVKFAVSTKADYASFFIFVPYPGTTGFKLALENRANLKMISDKFHEVEIQTGGIVELNDVSRKKLEIFQLLGYANFYLRPSKIKNLFRMISPFELVKTIAGMFTGKW